MVTPVQHCQLDGGDHRGHGRMLPLLLVAATVLLQGCGGDGAEPAQQGPRHASYRVTQPVASYPSVSPGRSVAQANSTTGNRWAEWSQRAVSPADGRDYPQARSPWQGPPVGFGRDMAQGQMIWPQPQPQPELPKFRPWEEEHAKDQAVYTPGLVAPYDRLMGSSQRGGQQLWPGYYPGYPSYPSTGMGYPGVPATWGVAGPGMGWPFAMGMWPGW